MEVELLVGVNIVPDPGQQDQVEEPLGHLLFQVRREDACRLHRRNNILVGAQNIVVIGSVVDLCNLEPPRIRIFA